MEAFLRRPLLVVLQRRKDSCCTRRTAGANLAFEREGRVEP